MPTQRLGNVLTYLRRVTPAKPAAPTDGDLLAQFVTGREEAAFAGLVERHGPMVLGVCERVLHDAHDAEDAFQATFLVLVRRAAAIRKRTSVGSWLYGVAYRTALCARRRSARRRLHERQAHTMHPGNACDEVAWDEMRPVLDAELAALPEKYRAPLVLCYFEGKSNAEAARQLGWTRGTVSGRLARARELLRGRLAGRGLACSGAALVLTLSEHAAAASVPAALQAATVQAAAMTLAGAGSAVALTSALASAPAVTLAQGVLNAMFLAKIKTVFTVVVVLTGLGVGSGWIAVQAIAGEGGSEQAAAGDPQDPAQLKEENARLRQELVKARRQIRRLQDEIKLLRDEGPAARRLAEDARARAEAERRLAQQDERLAQEARTRAQEQGDDAAQKIRQAADRTRSANNLKYIAIAMHNYHDTYKRFPPAAISTRGGKPLLSWRVAILPFIEQENLFKEFKLDEPWDSEHNKTLLDKMPGIYAPVGVKSKDKHLTFYQVFTGKDTIFAGNKGSRLVDITDGTSNTILAVEAAQPVPWTKPQDLPYDANKALPKLGGLFKEVKEGFHLLLADGSVRFVRANFNERALRAAITRSGGEVFDFNDLDR